MAAVPVPLGAVAPAAFRYTGHVPRDPVTKQLRFNASKVTAAEFRVRRGRSRGHILWTATIVEKNPERVILEHPFVIGDLAELGLHLHVQPVLTTPSGLIMCTAKELVIVDPFEL